MEFVHKKFFRISGSMPLYHLNNKYHLWLTYIILCHQIWNGIPLELFLPPLFINFLKVNFSLYFILKKLKRKWKYYDSLKSHAEVKMKKNRNKKFIHIISSHICPMISWQPWVYSNARTHIEKEKNMSNAMKKNVNCDIYCLLIH